MGGEIDNAALLEIIKKLLKTDATLAELSPIEVPTSPKALSGVVFSA